MVCHPGRSCSSHASSTLSHLICMFGIVIAVVNLGFSFSQNASHVVYASTFCILCIGNSDAVLAEAVHMAFVSEQEMQANLLAVHIYPQ